MSEFSIVDSICGGGKTGVPKNSSIPMLAQYYAYALYRNYFRFRYPGGATYHEWDITQGVGSGRPIIDVAAGQIRSDFRNYAAQTDKNKKLAKSGQMSKLKEGRQVRGDAIGLAIDPIERKIVCELLEVTTIDEAQKCISEDLQPKLALLRGPIKKLLDEKLCELRSNASMVPQEFIASGTPWIIPAELTAIPIFGSANASPLNRYRWICFAQTYIYRPFPTPSPFFTTPEPEAAPARGLILYSYHETNDTGLVPVEVIKKYGAWLRQQANNQKVALQLLPVSTSTQYWQQNTTDLQQFLTYLAIGAVVVGAVVLAFYLAPILFPAEALLLTEAATAPAMALTANGANLVQQFSAALPVILGVTQTAINSAVNVGGSLHMLPGL